MEMSNLSKANFKLRINAIRKECNRLKINTHVYGNIITGITFIVKHSKPEENEWVITVNDSLTKSLKEIIKEFKTEYDILRLLDQI